MDSRAQARRALALGLALAAGGCVGYVAELADGGEWPGPPPLPGDGGGATPDGGDDAGQVPGPDAGADAGLPPGPDAGADAGGPPGPDAGADAGLPPGPDAGADGGSPPGPDAGPGIDAGICSTPPGDRLTQVCTRWKCELANLKVGTWTANTATCTAGDFSADGKQSVIRLVNFYRYLVDLPPVANDPVRDQKVQQCSLMMAANGALSHTPPSTWRCYTADGAQAAGNSNIATTSAVPAIGLYMVDPGNPTTIGHRRWLLSNRLGPIGVGSASYSCLWVLGGSGSGSRSWTAWPPPGPVPYELLSPGGTSVDDTGWTIQSDSINLSGAQVAVTDSGAGRPVTVTQLLSGYGSTYAIRFNPQGWRVQTGHTYSVNVTGVSSPFTYDVQPVTCP